MLKSKIPYDPILVLLGIYPKFSNLPQRYLNINVPNAHQYLENCLKSCEKTLYTIEFYSAITESENFKEWISLESLILIEMRHSEKDKSHMPSYTQILLLFLEWCDPVYFHIEKFVPSFLVPKGKTKFWEHLSSCSLPVIFSHLFHQGWKLAFCMRATRNFVRGLCVCLQFSSLNKG